MKQIARAFTIVELAVVILIIGILSSVAIFGYGAWQKRTAENVLKSDLSMAASQLKNDLNWSNAYPETAEAADGGKGLPKSDGTTYSYDRIANNEYCLTATSSRDGIPSFHVTQDANVPQQGACTPSSMQAMTKSYCLNEMETFTGSNESAIITLADNRGGTTRSYRAARLADGNCWMLDNLKLGSTSGTITLMPADSDIDSDFTLPRLLPAPGNSLDQDSPRSYGPVTGDTGDGATNYGYSYNYSAATAGESRTSHPPGAGSAPHSICPKGWRLPVGGTGGEFAILNAKMNNPSATSPAVSGFTGYFQNWQYDGPFKGVFAGYWTGVGFSKLGTMGHWWSSYAEPSYMEGGYAVRLNNGSSVSTQFTLNRHHGASVRCILR